jgi:alanine racemase
LPQVEEISLTTHFSDADGAKGIEEQLRIFNVTTQDLPGERSVANSAATLRHSVDAAADWVRPCIALYGSSPDFPEHTYVDWTLLPAMTLSSKIIATQAINTPDTVGYGSSFKADKPMAIGVVACGYADGYPRHCSTGTPVLVQGIRTRMVGRVSMDMITVDLEPVILAGIEVGVGSEVTLWGRASNGTVLSIDEVAQAGGTVRYELMCAFAQRVPVLVDPD